MWALIQASYVMTLFHVAPEAVRCFLCWQTVKDITSGCSSPLHIPASERLFAKHTSFSYDGNFWKTRINAVPYLREATIIRSCEQRMNYCVHLNRMRQNKNSPENPELQNPVILTICLIDSCILFSGGKMRDPG